MSSFPRHGWPGGTDRYCCKRRGAYIQRKLIKALEDCKVAYDRSVRNAGGSYSSFSARTVWTALSNNSSSPMPIDSYSAIAVEYLLTSGDLDSSPDA
jgi:hypothetical protein